MFYGYCFTEVNGWHTPKVKLNTMEELFAYCKLQSNLFPEIRITDEDDFLVMHVVNSVLYVPFPEGEFKSLNLRTNEVRTLTKAQMESETGISAN